ncbi:serine/threonine protein kinase [Leptolyngbya sp. FACHB-541]|uniref:serine/threonine-protein kinase n=1 Tax=Leptolyngbya sp. FACHB-541 TaxID=2692810 RepID=UPI0016845EF9|nr:serine/threonine-protein kinase [Leptolyngbya sp. FACHB-541]MBD1995609.1 serine/threonine protein kinase [Leptolyngbya sp. FACHB-541]
MDCSIATLSNLRSSAQHQTHLGQLCGSRKLFRDRYRIVRALGRGGFGVTFLARDMTLPGTPLCVIKQLCPKVSNPAILERAKERFEREAKTLSQLGSHAQVPQLLDYFELDGEFYLIQEYIKGCTLAKEVKNGGVQSEAAVKRFLREILPVLDYIHRHKVIHRDIKPPNIIRCQDDGRLVLIDFGAVKEQIAQASEVTQKATTTNFVGTVGFAPPEQLSLRPLYASDIYAIGVTCLYLLTGKPPLEFDYDPATAEICWQEFVQVSDHFAVILGKMLKISPRDRYRSAKQILRALDLEPHLDQLADCMNTQRRLANPEQEEATSSDGYVSPISRTAAAIRDWRTRLQDKEHKQNLDLGNCLANGYRS